MSLAAAATGLDWLGGMATDIFNIGPRIGAAGSMYGSLANNLPNIHNQQASNAAFYNEQAAPWMNGATDIRNNLTHWWDSGQAGQGGARVGAIQDHWRGDGGIFNTAAQQWAQEQGAWNNLTSQAELDYGAFQQQNQDFLNAAQDVYGTTTDFATGVWDQVQDFAGTQAGEFRDMSTNVLNEVRDRGDAALDSMVNRAGEMVASVSRRAWQGLDQARQNLRTQFESGAMTQGQYDQAQRELDYSHGEQMHDMRREVSGQENQRFTEAALQVSAQIGEVGTSLANQFVNLSSNLAATLGQTGSSLSSTIQQAGETLTRANQAFVENALNGSMWITDTRQDAAMAMERRHNAHRALNVGYSQMYSQALHDDINTHVALQNGLASSLEYNAITQMQMRSQVFNETLGAATFDLQGHATAAGFLTNVQLNPAAWTGASQSLANYQALQNPYGASQSSGGGYMSGFGMLAGAGAGLAIGGPQGAMVGGMMGGGAGSIGDAFV